MSGTTKYGDSSLFNNTGPNNSAFGNYAAYNNLDASCNTAIGSNALFLNTTGEHNTSIGAGSMCNNTIGSLNTAIGSSALEGISTTIGNGNVAIGAQALYDNSGASYNTAIGTFSGYYNTSGNYNTFLGFGVDVSNNGTAASGIYNYSTAIGYQATIDASNQMVLGTSTEHIKIPGSYVGIGGVYNINETPNEYNLDVSGNINFSGLLLQNGSIYGGSGSIYGDSGSSEWTTSGTNIYNNKSGNIGIGTSSPTYKLDVSGNLRTTADALINNLTVGRGSGNAATNTSIGYEALINNTSDGTKNTAVGYKALAKNTDGDSNTALGSASLFNNTTGDSNIAIGRESLLKSITGSTNIAIGRDALNNIEDASGNVAIGSNAGSDLSGKSGFNTFLGYEADVSSNKLIYNYSTAIGYQATIDASNQIVLGRAAEKVKIPGTYVGIGGVYAPSAYTLDVSGNLRTTADALINNLTVGRGSGNAATNTSIGYEALINNTSDGTKNTAVGYKALAKNTDGDSNTALGSASLFNNTTGDSNIAIGRESLLKSITGSTNIAIGRDALNNIEDASGNVAIGSNAGSDLSGKSGFNTFLGYEADVSSNKLIYNYSTAIGYQATIDASNQIVLGRAAEKVKIPGTYVGIGGVYAPSAYTLDVSGNLRTTADALINNLTVGRGSGNAATNTAIGFNSLYSNTTGGFNTAIGFNSLYSNTTGNTNIAIGPACLSSNTTGGFNTAIGRGSLYSNTTGGFNIAIGYESLYYNVASGNVAIGYNAGGDLSGNSGFNTFLGYKADVSNTTLIYNNSTAIGNGAIIDVSNCIVLGNSAIQFLKCQVALTVVSDARDKTNFEPLDAGVNFINEINPVRFDWNQRAGGLEGRKDVGFTAQDLIEAQEKTKISIPHLVDVSNPEKYTIMNTQLLPILVKAVQELSAKVTSLETELSELKK